MKNSKVFRCLAFLGLAITLVGTACKGPDKSITFSVAFDTGGGSAVETQMVPNADKATRPADPTRDGYEFVDWYIDKNYATIFDFDKMPITANWTVYAKWNKTVTPNEPVSPTAAYTYVVTGLPAWIRDNDCVIFAWAWPNGSPGAWYEFVYDDDDWGHFDTEEEMGGFLLARCVAGTTTPDWEIHAPSNDLGRVYNQTANINVVSGQESYTCNSWQDYN